MINQISRSVGDYLKAIYTLSEANDTTSTVSLADYLSVAPSSVTSMIKKLAKFDPPLINYQKSYGVSLTNAGEITTLKLIRRHRLLETFLVKILGYQWEDVHGEADELEHVISSQFEDSMADLLGEPQFDPHGDPIPARDLSIPSSSNIPLSQLSEGTNAVIRRVQISQSDLLQHLGKNGLKPGAAIRIGIRNPFDETLQLIVGTGENHFVIGPDISVQIFVEILSDNS